MNQQRLGLIKKNIPVEVNILNRIISELLF